MGLPSKPDYFLVEIGTLQPGYFLDRTLYLFMESSNRFIPYVRPLQFLDQNLINKIRKFKKVYSDVGSIDERHENFSRQVSKLRRILDDSNLASFEKNHALCAELNWIILMLFNGAEETSLAAQNQNKILPIFLINRVLKTPKLDSFKKLSDENMKLFEQAVILAAISTLYAMLLGYYNYEFLCRLFESFFISAFKSNDLVGVQSIENRFASLNEGDEIYEISQLAKWSLGDDVAEYDIKRLKRKLTHIFKFEKSIFAKGFLKQALEGSSDNVSDNSSEGVAA